MQSTAVNADPIERSLIHALKAALCGIHLLALSLSCTNFSSLFVDKSIHPNARFPLKSVALRPRLRSKMNASEPRPADSGDW